MSRAHMRPGKCFRRCLSGIMQMWNILHFLQPKPEWPQRVVATDQAEGGDGIEESIALLFVCFAWDANIAPVCNVLNKLLFLGLCSKGRICVPASVCHIKYEAHWNNLIPISDSKEPAHMCQLHKHMYVCVGQEGPYPDQVHINRNQIFPNWCLYCMHQNTVLVYTIVMTCLHDITE